MPLTAEEKVKIRHHMGYLNVAAAQTFVLGSPAGVETQFIIEGAMDKVLDAALTEVRRHLAILDQLEAQMVEDHELLAVNTVGEIDIREDEQEALDKRYQRWQRSLGNLLGCYPNPYDKRFAGSSINVPVSH